MTQIKLSIINYNEKEYEKSWNKISYHNNKLIHYNMFISSREIMNMYCEWLFPLLFEVEKRVKISDTV